MQQSNLSIQTVLQFIEDNLATINNAGKVSLDVQVSETNTHELITIYNHILQDNFHIDPNTDDDDDLYSCILSFFTHVDKKVYDMFMKQFVGEIKNKYKEFKYKSLPGWSVSKLENAVTKCDNIDMVMKYLTDFLHINIVVLDYEGMKTYGNSMFRRTIVLLQDNRYIPLHYRDQKYFTPDDDVFETIFGTVEMSIHSESSNFVMSDKLNAFDDYTVADIEDSEFVDNRKSIVWEVKEEEDNKIKKKPVINSSLKVAELRELAEEYGIEISYYDATTKRKKNKTKQMLINELKAL